MNPLSFEKQSDTSYKCIFANGVEIGLLLQEVDGYMVFYPDTTNGGFWESYVLRTIADKLDELNRPWDEQLKREFPTS